VPGYPWVPLVFAASAFLIVANQIVAQPVDSLLGLGLVLLGVPIHALVNRHRTAKGMPS
jgi:APA family basic amino acid/polyamine antiporter